MADATIEAKPGTSPERALKKIKRPPNSFMIFAGGHRTELVAYCNKPGADFLATMTEFAEQTSVHPAQIQRGSCQNAGKPSGKAAKVPLAATPVKEWLASLGLAPDGDWGAVKSVSNNIISKMLARKWSWMNLVQPQRAKSYVDAQRRAKTAHELENPGYKYAPVQKTKTYAKKKMMEAKRRKKTKRSAFKLNQQLGTGTANPMCVPMINLNPTTPPHNKNGPAAEPPATTADADVSTDAVAAAQAQVQAQAQDQTLTQPQQAQARAVFNTRAAAVAAAKVGGAADGAWAIPDPEPVSPCPMESLAPVWAAAKIGMLQSPRKVGGESARERVNGGAGSYNQGMHLLVRQPWLAESYCNMEGLLEVGSYTRYPDAPANRLPALFPGCSLDDEAILSLIESGSIDDVLPDLGEVPGSIDDVLSDHDDLGDSGIFEPGTFKL